MDRPRVERALAEPHRAIDFTVYARAVRLAPIQPGDVVEVDKKGRRFLAHVLGRDRDGTLRVEPVCRGVSWRRASAREVVRHWTKAARRRGPRDPDQHEQQLGLGLDEDA